MQKNNENELHLETSPYLLQHANNPVHWKAWNEKTIEKAKKENKLIFLSIGYSTCHWCHVMEKESFENEEIAAALNQSYISIKVDKEAQPVVDKVFMNLAVAVNGSGGWPLSIFLTPDLKPFFLGTYFPPYNFGQRKGFYELLHELSTSWQKKPELLKDYAEKLTLQYQQFKPENNQSALNNDLFEIANQDFLTRFDFNYGGFTGQKNKFPSPQNLDYLLLQFERTNNTQFLDAAEFTLQSMRAGGIFDHIGFGFHRYSTDQYWLVPHFEKMLYDQASLLSSYSSAYALTKNELYKRVCLEIMEYLNREMRSVEGGYYSAEDADSEGEEGTFYLFSKKEIQSILAEDEYAFFIKHYAVEDDGNFMEEASQKKIGTNIIHLIDQTDKIETIQQDKQYKSIRKKLFDFREKRIHPFKDKKIQLDGNAQIAASIARAARIFGNNDWKDHVIDLMQWLKKEFYKENEQSFHHFLIDNKQAQGEETLDDKAFFIAALIEIYFLTFDIDWLEKAYQLQQELNDQYYDHDTGGFYFSAINAKLVIKRLKDDFDGAYPSGNSIAVHNLIYLGKFFDNNQFLLMAEKSIQLSQDPILQYPLGYAKMLSNADFICNQTFEIIVVGEQTDAEYQAIKEWLLKESKAYYFPIFINKENKDKLAQLIAYTNEYTHDFKETKIFVCQNYQCHNPVSNLADAKKILLN